MLIRNTKTQRMSIKMEKTTDYEVSREEITIAEKEMQDCSP